MNAKRTALALTGVCLFQAGWMFGQLSDTDAHAQEPVTSTPEAPGAPPRLLCRTFARDPGANTVLETSDQTSEIGQWIGEQAEQGWQLDSVDFEVGQKVTGFPQAWLHVCLAPR